MFAPPRLPQAPPPPNPARRRFLERVSIGLASLAAIAIAIPTGWFLLGPLLRYVPAAWRPVGKPGDFPEGQTVRVAFPDVPQLAWSGDAGVTAAWLHHAKSGEFIAYAVYCTHLGCPVRWEPSAKLFLCPCHGGVYYADGTVAAGPPPRPLPRYPVRVRNGQVEIRTTRLPIAGVA
jgi:menaquinol-cytochrome c reductase iron-sulfur subunit